jgi:predicted SAM-dependent methyltransferase
MNRSEILHSLFDVNGKGIEIGPSFNPLLRKADGYNVEIVDHLSAEDLREKYKDANVDLNMIEDVDYISDGGLISELIDKPHNYDFCIALHVIEHTIDLIGFLRDCQTLLKEKGVLVLAVPDKRFSFDVLRPVCSTGDVIQAYLEGRKSHSIGKMFDELAYNCLRSGQLAWERGHRGELKFFRMLDDARTTFSQIQQSRKFIDIHTWQFTPSSFRLIVHDLNQFDFIQLKEKTFLDVGTGEFYMTLSCDGGGCPEDRLDLARRAMEEQAQTSV